MDTIRTIRIASSTIATIGAVVSYATQAQLLKHWQMDTPSAIAIPATVDLLGIICLVAIHSREVTDAGRRVAYWILPIVGAVSITANALGGHTWGARAGHMWPVIAYMLGETIAAVAGKRRPAGPTAEEIATAQLAAKRSDAAKKAAATRRRRAGEAAKSERASIRAARQAMAGTTA
jgi:hypothetical protein